MNSALVPVYIDTLSLLCIYTIITFIITFYFSLSIFFLSALLGRAVSKHFTVSLHLLFMKHVTNSIGFDLMSSDGKHDPSD